MNTLIIGGTSGLGLELAKQFRDAGDEVIITGRKNPNIKGLSFQKFNLDLGSELSPAIDSFVSALPKVDRFVYAAGFFQGGTITELEQHEINEMLDVGLNAPIWFIRELLQTHGSLKEFVAITSTSQWTPRKLEPVYTAVKAGLGMFANSVAEDERVEKVLVAGPAGMSTAFWRASGMQDASYNDPTWVAKQIISALKADFSYAFVKILRDPPRVEVAETR